MRRDLHVHKKETTADERITYTQLQRRRVWTAAAAAAATTMFTTYYVRDLEW